MRKLRFLVYGRNGRVSWVRLALDVVILLVVVAGVTGGSSSTTSTSSPSTTNASDTVARDRFERAAATFNHRAAQIATAFNVCAQDSTSLSQDATCLRGPVGLITVAFTPLEESQTALIGDVSNPACSTAVSNLVDVERGYLHAMGLLDTALSHPARLTSALTATANNVNTFATALGVAITACRRPN